MWINACQRQVDLEQIYSTDKPADGRLINPKLNIVALQLVVVLRTKPLTITIHFFISFMCEGWLRLSEPCIMWSQCDTVRVSGAKPSTEFDYLVVCCCIADLNYSQL